MLIIVILVVMLLLLSVLLFLYQNVNYIEQTKVQNNITTVIPEEQNAVINQKTNQVTDNPVERAHVAKITNMYLDCDEFTKLAFNRMNISGIKDEIGEGSSLENGYVLYDEANLKIKFNNYGQVINIVLLDDYQKQVANGIDMHTKLSDIRELYPENAFGSMRDGMLGYKIPEAYMFCYDDEISLYSHQYTYDSDFEKALIAYIETKEFETFINYMRNNWYACDTFEYDFETQSAHITYPNKGIEINIQRNDTTGVILYNNYYFTDKTRQLVKNESITFKDEDLIEVFEEHRRNSQ